MAKILVVDDDPAIRLILKKSLQREGHEITVAVNGAEGLLRARQIQPALIICDWMMPLMNGLEVCRRLKADAALITTFFILLTARGLIEDRVEGLDAGADEFLTKPIDLIELHARVRAGLRLHQVNLDLQRQKQHLEDELAEAAAYVQSLLPPRLTGEVTIESCFIPSRQLGGDCFDYRWLDPDHLSLYLLDVSGHGLGSALPSVTILNLLRSHALPDANFYQPADVLRALNLLFQMDGHNAKYFTIWYGVYNRVERQLTYASAGHPPAILVTPPSDDSPHCQSLKTVGLPIGMMAEAQYVSDRKAIPPGSVLYIFSDGIYDLSHCTMTWGLHSFVELLASSSATIHPEEILQVVRHANQIQAFEDDLSLLKVQF